jgi:DNA-binding Lrp family transcriptional regulator
MKSFPYEKSDLDGRDLAILKCLQNDPRLGIADLARQVEFRDSGLGVPPPLVPKPVRQPISV